MWKIIVLFLIIFVIYLKTTLHLNIDVKSFFRKGFRKKDNQFGVFCYCGKQGRGKTYSAIRFCINRRLDNNSLIITNVHSFNIFKDTIFIDDINTLIDFVINLSDDFEKKRKLALLNNEDYPDNPNIVIFFDEIFTILEKNTRLNTKILSFLSQLRKRSIVFVTTAQEWLEINVTFRRYVRFQVNCNMISTPLSQSAILINEVNDGEQLHWDNLANDYIAPRIMTNIAKGNLSIIESYDTFETISTNIKDKKGDKISGQAISARRE